MSTDRELLEAAAKAAGFAETGWQDLSGWGEVRYGLSEAIWTGEDYWNPLQSDSDAFRLAVALKIDISWDAFQDTDVMVSHDDQWWTAPYGDDPAASLRLAIVRAAAALART